jgi:quinol monooxygenase YgiN
MPQDLLTVVAEMVAKPGKEEELRTQLLALVAPTRREGGCVQYDLHVSKSESGRFIFCEIWTSGDALDRHLKSPHFTAFQGVADGLLAEPPRVLTLTRIS